MRIRREDVNALRTRAGIYLRRNPILAAVTLLAVAVAFIGAAVLDEQAAGRERDRRLGETVDAIQGSRVESIDTLCGREKSQNRVILAILEVSYAARPGVSEAERVVRRLSQPLTEAAVDAACAKLKERVRAGPPAGG